MFNTSCGSCIFAQYKGPVHIDCELDRINKFYKQGRAEFDNDACCYIIKGVCNTARGETWKEVNKGSNLVSKVLNEIQLRIDVVLYIDNEDVGQAVSACAKQETIKPQRIIVVAKNSSTKFTEIYNVLQTLTEPYEIPFRLVRILETDATIDRCVEIGFEKCSSQYTAVFNTSHKIPINFIKRLNNKINHDLQQIVLVEPTNNYSGMIITTNAFEKFDKNRDKPVFEKIVDFAKETKKTEMILNWENL